MVEGGPVVRLKAHTPHNLTCSTSGAKPAAEVTWYRDVEVMETAVYSKVRGGGAGTLPPHPSLAVIRPLEQYSTMAHTEAEQGRPG